MSVSGKLIYETLHFFEEVTGFNLQDLLLSFDRGDLKNLSKFIGNEAQDWKGVIDHHVAAQPQATDPTVTLCFCTVRAMTLNMLMNSTPSTGISQDQL